MKLSMIAAIGKNRELGKDNGLIWHFPSDLKFFKEMTKGHTMVMGRKTFESLPGMLPNRKHLVISKSHPSLPEQVEIFESIEAFLEKYSDTNEEIFVIGGGMLYAQMLNYADRLILTEIDQSYDADTFFPDFDRAKYTREVVKEYDENGAHLVHAIYVKN